MFFNTSLEIQGGNPILKKKSLPELIEIRETFNLCDIWRIRNPKSKFFTFHQNHVSGRIQRRLDYFLISNFLEETVIRADVLASFCSGHGPIIFTIAFESNSKRGKGLWEFNKSLLSNDEYINKLRNHISVFLIILYQKGIRDDQIRWEFIKFEIRQITFSKNLPKSLNVERQILENELKDFENSGSSYFDNEGYLACKKKFDKIYEKGEKSTKFFLNLEKRHAIQNEI